MRPLLEGNGALKEIPRAQRWACLEYGYAMAAGAREAGIHYSTVSKVIRRER